VKVLTHFKLKIGFECGVDKSICTLGYPEYCGKCISKKFSEAHFLTEVLDIAEEDREEKRQKMNYRYIWTKYRDILNIRHIIILSKTGIDLFNMPVGDLPIDATLLSGFIQANIIFSSEGLTKSDRMDFGSSLDTRFYEFQYKHFNILLREGNLSRVALVLDKKASKNLRDLLSNFTAIFEGLYHKHIMAFSVHGNTKVFVPVKELIEKTFEIYMIYPQTLSAQIPPNIIENFTLIQQAVYEFSKDLLKEKSYFFIPNVLNITERILGVKSKEEIIWNIYQMCKNQIIVSKDLEFQRDEIESKEAEIKQRGYEISKIIEFKSAEVDPVKIQALPVDEAKKQMNNWIKRAEVAEKNHIYSDAINNLRCALIYAREFKLNTDIGRIAYKILEVIKLNKLVELKFATEQSKKAESKKDYVRALKYLFQIKDILLFDNRDDNHNKRVTKVGQKIQKLQNLIK